jgi:hypothetical protein
MVKETKFFRKQAAKAERLARAASHAEISQRFLNMATTYRSQADVLKCLDHVVVFGERHLRHLLRSYASYYNAARTHLSVNKDAPMPRTVDAVGRIVPTPFLGGPHHLYVRV